MKIFIIVTILIIFNGCSEFKETGSSNLLYYQQWSINEDLEFYYEHDIDEDAGINPKNVFQFFNGEGVKVAIIDDGFDVNHPEIREKIIKTISVDEYGNIGNNVSHINTQDYHGTAVAGIIAADNNNVGIMGVSSGVELILIRMPMMLSDDITIELFKQAVNAGADIINCSWGTGDVSDSVREYIDYISTYARDGKGVVVVFAAGNLSTYMANDESAIESVIGVGATDKNSLRTNYSNYGKELDIVAPGGLELGITTIDPYGSDGVSADEYNRYDELDYGLPVSFIGTSAAAPIISGVIALALEKNFSLNRVEVQELLKISTTKIGQNTPYIDDMIVSSSATPIISGLYGSLRDIEFKVQLTSYRTNTIYGPYYVYETYNNEWASQVFDTLPNGIYTVEVISDDSVVWATDVSFEVNHMKSSQIDKSKRRSDFYGYGKIDLDKLIQSI
ncbi:MAG: hypothetical protein DRI32_04795 [Chloroflexi bacterium]|nr:MAG: hypothetical protein DRI32_04795 [Chloroflexota bacterium]